MKRGLVGAPRRRRSQVRVREADEELDRAVRAVVRAQLRLALTTCGLVAAVLVLLTATFALVPAVRAADVLGVPLPWVVLTIVVHPLWFALAWTHVRRCERLERRLPTLRSNGPP
ncbi:hypothetical protein [Bailinhaonella thermotolerans]|uniref:DUF485 domain-containing protein n=1 Tax=Bailinhaonella thermotolerans TaxID=1070861 RepID=A0A3A4ANZ3_9ACTN|nr:hypothetical protein [Bailinhaonella thermotolerans]RJL31386.1 hypothetical protein D5H75_20335 [Bailinhaonella thermotolerans]